MQICPYCHKPHDDAPSTGRSRVCAACYAAAESEPVADVPKKKRRSKQTPNPIEPPPPLAPSPAI